MEQHIDQLLNDFLTLVAERGVHMKGYNSTCSRILNHFNESGEKDYSEEVLSSYLLFCESEVESGLMSLNYYKFQKRVVRMIRSLSITGKIDFSQPRLLKYPVTVETETLINTIFDQCNVKEKRRKNLISVMRHFFWFADKKGYKVSQIDDDVILSFLLDEIPITNKRQNKHIYQCIRYITYYLTHTEKNNICYDYSKLKHQNDSYRLLPPFSESEITTILSSIDVSTPIGKRNYAIIALAYETGFRCIDIASLKRTDIDWYNLEAKIIQSKTADPVIAELNGEVANAISDYILNGRPQTDIPYVFIAYGCPFRRMSTSAIQTMFEKVCANAGIKKIPGRSFHSLRRSFEVELTKKGISLETVSKMAGHRSINSDKPYLTYNQTETSYIALGFQMVPIRKGIYSRIFN